MKNLAATVLGACAAMLMTSGVVALATAQSEKAPAHERIEPRPVEDESVPTDEAYAFDDSASDDELDQRISALIDSQYKQVVEKRAAL